jgi:hypothetical protein
MAADEGVIVWQKVDPSSALARQAVQIALPEFQQRGPHIENHETLIFLAKSADGTPLEVGGLFRDPDTPAGMRRSSEDIRAMRSTWPTPRWSSVRTLRADRVRIDRLIRQF